MEQFQFNKSKVYLIYGAAIKGQEIYRSLTNAGYQIAAFLDKRADVLDGTVPCPVFFPQAYPVNAEHMVVIIAVGNSFEHISIAEYLNKLGYNKIIYFMYQKNGMAHSYGRNMAAVYQKIVDGSICDLDKVYYYNSEQSDGRFQNGAWIKTDGGKVIAFVPLDICFSSLETTINVSKEGNEPLYERLDTPIYYGFDILINYYKALNGTSENAPEAVKNMNDFVSANEGEFPTFPKTAEGQSKLLANRQLVYNGMVQHLSEGMDFFLDTPIMVDWNEKGYFNIVDGLNRACFFCAMGIPRIPSIMKSTDYEKWLNADAAVLCIEFAKSHSNLLPSYTPLEHPSFYHYPIYRDAGGYTRIQKICMYLAQKKIGISGTRILDIGSYYSFFSRFFCRMGADVTSVEMEEEAFEFATLLNQLQRCGNISIIHGAAQNLSVDRHFNITLLLTVLYWHLDTEIGLQLMNKVDELTDDMMIWESGGEPERERQYIFEHSAFKIYEKIGETTGSGLVRELGAFYKKLK